MVRFQGLFPTINGSNVSSGLWWWILRVEANGAKRVNKLR